MTKSVDQMLQTVQAILTPTLCTVRPLKAAVTVGIAGVEHDFTMGLVRLTCLFDHTGHPVLSLPVNGTSDPLTSSIQIIGPHFGEESVLSVAGMIQPNMATMLVYIATDAKLSRDCLQEVLLSGADQSFNRITVDSDTSTNDSCMLTATGVSGVVCDAGAAATSFKDSLHALMQELAQGIIRDAEGATKFVTVTVTGGKCEADCLSVAYAIANSPLMKTALFASDANWGRIVMAIGKADADIDPEKIDVYLGDVQLMAAGGKEASYVEEAGAAVMQGEEITIKVDLNLGEAIETVWTSDLSHDYVSINADYRT